MKITFLIYDCRVFKIMVLPLASKKRVRRRIYQRKYTVRRRIYQRKYKVRCRIYQRKYMSQNVVTVHSAMCAQRRLRSDCASAQSDQSLCCTHEETLHHWLSTKRPVKILIRLIWNVAGHMSVGALSDVAAHKVKYIEMSCVMFLLATT